jgi:hypothetical protein
MRSVSTHLESRAREIFQELGYTVSTEGRSLRAERKWRVVHVTPTTDATEVPAEGDFRCFVTDSDRTDRLERRLASRELPYEWAVIGVSDRGDYEVATATTLDQ